MTKHSYMKAVINGLRAVDTVDVTFIPSGGSMGNSTDPIPMNDTSAKKKKICVRLLLSIDRRETTAAAMETVCWS